MERRSVDITQRSERVKRRNCLLEHRQFRVDRCSGSVGRARATIDVDGTKYGVFRLAALSQLSGGNADRLPFSLKILLENLLRTRTTRS